MMLIEVDTPEVSWARYYARKALEIVESELREAEDAVAYAESVLESRRYNLDSLLERATGARRLASLAGVEPETVEE